MNVSLLVLKQVSIMLVLMSLGYYAYRKRFLTPQGSKDLSAILMYIIVPAVTIKSFMIESTAEKTRILFNSLGFGAVSLVITVALAFLFFRKNRTLSFGVTFSNAGFIGIPLIYNTLGPEAVFYMLAFLTMQSITMWTYGIFTLTGKKESMSLKTILRNPVLLFTAIGLVLYFTQWQLPGFVLDTLNFMTPVNTPIAMFVIGSMIAEIPFKVILGDPHIYKAAAVRLLIIPAAVGLAFAFMPGGSDQALLMKAAILIVSAAPSAANTAILSKLLNLEADDGVKIVCLTTVLSVATIPVVVFLYEQLLNWL